MKSGKSGQTVGLVHPQRHLHVRRHVPAAARGEAHAGHLRAIRHGGTLELLGEEAADKRAQRGEDRLPAVHAVKRLQSQRKDLFGAGAAVHHVPEEEVVQLIRAEGFLGFLRDFAVLTGDQLRRDGCV